jgi:Uma2 family endonuclease
MGAAVKVSLEEYLSTSYRPDCDYIDGEVVERNLGDFDHSDIQAALVVWFRTRCKQPGLWAGPELRVIVSERRVRVPDLTVILGGRPSGRFVTEPPFLVVEVLSERDNLRSIQDRIDDYRAMGIRHIWAVDPETLTGWDASTGVAVEAKDRTMRTREPEIILPLEELR